MVFNDESDAQERKIDTTEDSRPRQRHARVNQSQEQNVTSASNTRKGISRKSRRKKDKLSKKESQARETHLRNLDKIKNINQSASYSPSKSIAKECNANR